MIDTNLRSIKRANERYTLLTAKQMGEKRELCNYCAKQRNCKTLNSVGRVQRRDTVSLSVINCLEYSPPIMFRNTSGTESCFNTIRLGTAWSKRVVQGTVVGLLGPDGERFREAEVVSVIVGDKSEMLLEHSLNNHLLIDDDLDKQTAFERMSKMLPALYGNLPYTRNDQITVIYLEV